MAIVKNPRVGESFKYPNLKCSICHGLNSYLLQLEPYQLCKSCLTDFIKEIDTEILKDIKKSD